LTSLPAMQEVRSGHARFTEKSIATEGQVIHRGLFTPR
jgi:hypothetical protein